MVFDCSFDLTALQRASSSTWPSTSLAPSMPTSTTPSRPAMARRAPPAPSLPRRPTRPPRAVATLPSREKFAAWLCSVGFSNDMQAVVYDRNGSSYCGRLWWMLQWLGHANVAVLDGGLQAWVAAGDRWPAWQ